jgi:CBS domain-containing protein
MNVKVGDLMSGSVVTTLPHKSVEHVRALLDRNELSAVPIIDSEQQPVGIVSATDLLPDLKPNSPISTIMTEKVYTVPQYDDVSTAARVMRKHRIHRVVVTHEQRVVGVLSSFDLLELVEGHRFVAKNPPSESTRHSRSR